jgi:hypothetical protein
MLTARDVTVIKKYCEINNNNVSFSSILNLPISTREAVNPPCIVPLIFCDFLFTSKFLSNFES